MNDGNKILKNINNSFLAILSSINSFRVAFLRIFANVSKDCCEILRRCAVFIALVNMTAVHQKLHKHHKNFIGPPGPRGLPGQKGQKVGFKL